MRRLTAWRLLRLCLVRRTDFANRRRPLAFVGVDVPRCTLPWASITFPAAIKCTHARRRLSARARFLLFFLTAIAVSLSTYFHFCCFLTFVSCPPLHPPMRSVGHDAPNLPTAPAAVLASHERAQLVSRVTATGPWGSVGVWLEHNPRRFWPRLSQSSKLYLT